MILATSRPWLGQFTNILTWDPTSRQRVFLSIAICDGPGVAFCVIFNHSLSKARSTAEKVTRQLTRLTSKISKCFGWGAVSWQVDTAPSTHPRLLRQLSFSVPAIFSRTSRNIGPLCRGFVYEQSLLIEDRSRQTMDILLEEELAADSPRFRQVSFSGKLRKPIRLTR